MEESAILPFHETMKLLFFMYEREHL